MRIFDGIRIGGNLRTNIDKLIAKPVPIRETKVIAEMASKILLIINPVLIYSMYKKIKNIINEIRA